MEKHEADVLLVDDEKDFLELLSERLENRGLKVSSVTTGEEALLLVEQQEYDAIILDIAMPGIDGLETLQRIKKIRPDVEIIMLTGHATVPRSIEAMKLGAEDLLEKPVDLEVLLDKIDQATQKRARVLEKRSQSEVKNIVKSKSW